MNRMNQMNEMNEMNQAQDDEIDLIELFQMLWDGKWLISTFVAIAVLLGGGVMSRKDASYETLMNYSVDTIPPFYEPIRAVTDFQKKFFSADVFDDWKKNNGNVSLVFEDFGETEVVDGFVFSKGKGEQLAVIETFKKNNFVLVRSNQLPMLGDFFKYAQHINAILTKEYLQRAKVELNIIETRFLDFSTVNDSMKSNIGSIDRYMDDSIITNMLFIDRYVVASEQGSKVLAIQHPSKPKKVSPELSFILTISAALGGMVGVFFILVRNVIKKPKEPLAKA
jgi:hypothetical protein